jgi:hypothetical protein
MPPAGGISFGYDALLICPNGLYVTDRNGIVGGCMTFAKWHHIQLIISHFNHFYQTRP